VLAKDFKYFFFSNYPIAKNVKHPPREYVMLFLGKAVYFTYMLVLPIVVLQLPPLLVITAFVIMHYVLGTAMSWVFAISHVLDINDFPKSNRDFNHFSFQIIATTADYSVENPIANFLLGGFNHHTIHHFVPHVSHVHLPSLTRILKTTSEEYGVEYKANKTMYQGWIQHFRHLKQLGNSD
jgi:linoleoyl-CoA desaturase